MLKDSLPDLDYGRLVRASKRVDPPQSFTELRLALLSDAATQQFVPILRTLFYEHGVRAEIYEGPFDAIEMEVLDEASGLYKFKPDIIAVLNSVQALRAGFSQRPGDAQEFLRTTRDRIVRIWDTIQSRSAAT